MTEIHKSDLGLIDRGILFLIIIFIIGFIVIFSNKEFIFVLGIALFVVFVYITVLMILVYFKYPHECERSKFPKRVPSVAVVTYAFNNFKGVEKTVKRLCELEYPREYNVYVINDGTMGHLKKYPKVKLITLDKKYFKPGQNIKAKVMNKGFKMLKEENILATDGDTIPNRDVLMNMTGILTKDTGAVVGFIRPSNTKRWIEKLQMFEYNLFFAFWNYCFGVMDSIFVVCGPLNLINRRRFLEIGGFDTNNITEDAQLAFNFRDKGYKIKHSLDSIAETDVPSTLRKYFIQRTRWYRGGIYTWLKYKHLVFNKNSGIFGTIMFPYIIMVNIIGMAFVANLIWSAVYMFISYQVYYIYEVLSQDLIGTVIGTIKYFSLSDISVVLSSTYFLIFFTLVTAIFLGIVAFHFADFKLRIKDSFYYLAYVLIYSVLFTSIYLYSLLLEFIGYKYRW